MEREIKGQIYMEKRKKKLGKQRGAEGYILGVSEKRQLEELREAYPMHYLTSCPVVPFNHGEAALQHYNSAMTMAALQQHAFITGRHLRRIVRDDATYVVDSNCIVRSTETAFHVTIDLHITVDDLPHYQRRWVRSFERELL